VNLKISCNETVVKSVWDKFYIIWNIRSMNIHHGRARDSDLRRESILAASTVLHFPARSPSGFSPSTFAHREALAIRVTMRARPSSARRASERIPSSHSLWWLDSWRAERAREYFLLAHANGSTRGAPSERESPSFSLVLVAHLMRWIWPHLLLFIIIYYILLYIIH